MPDGAWVRAVLKAAGVTQGRLAEELGVHHVTVTRWIMGERAPEPKMRKRYADLVNEIAAEVMPARSSNRRRQTEQGELRPIPRYQVRSE